MSLKSCKVLYRECIKGLEEGIMGPTWIAEESGFSKKRNNLSWDPRDKKEPGTLQVDKTWCIL